MNNLKRIACLLAIFAVAIVVSVSYKGNDILARAIVLGLGVDVAEQGVSVTAEIVSPGNGSDQQIGTFSKIVTAQGETVAKALQAIAEKCGKETSLGQCVLLVYGEEFVQRDFSSTADYFIKSDSYKESATVCCCEGRAEDLLNQTDALSQSVSISLADKLKELSNDVAIPSCDLLVFARSQAELYKTGFLNFVRFEQSKNSDDQQSTEGYFVFDRIAVFRQNKLVGVLSKEETAGFALLSDVCGNTFAVNYNNKLLTVRANNKQVSVKTQGNTVKISIELNVKFARTDSFGAGGKFTAKTETEIPWQVLEQVKQQTQEMVSLYLQKQAEWEFDLIDIHESYRQQQGSTEEVKNIKMQDLQVVLSVTVQEK